MFQLIWKICTFQAKPEEVPYSVPLLLGKICVNLSVLIFILTIATGSIVSALCKSISLVAVIAIYSYLILYMHHVAGKFVQVLSALLSSMAMILVPLAIPYIIIMFVFTNTSSNLIYFSSITLASLILLLASMWLYVIFARIYRHAAKVSVNRGLTISLILFIICAIIFRFV